jgi:PelA/Pel-15E family pectate lyase
MRTSFRLLATLMLGLRFLSAQGTPAPAPSPAPVLKLEVKADYLALRVTGTTNIQSKSWQWRVLPGSAQDQVAWSHFDKPINDTTFKLATPMPAGGWYRVDVRAIEGDSVIKLVEVTRSEPPPFEMVTPSRIAALPEVERKVWMDYVAASQEYARTERRDIAAECRAVRSPFSKPAPANSEEFEFPTKVDAAYHASAEAAQLAEVVISYQTPTGGWSKAVDYGKGPRPRGTHWTSQSGDGWHYCGTLDNRSTTEQIKFLAQVFNATAREDHRKAVERGLEWLFAAQFPNGGWPQVYPLEPGYHEAITLNDDAMLHALEILRAVSLGEEPFAFCDAATKQRAASAYDRGIACLLAAQVSVKGRRTVWCAQHDPLTLAPVAARLKEPPSLSGGETTSLLKFLMRSGPTTEPVRQAIESAVAWLDAHKITDLRKITTPEGKTDYVKDPASTEVLWARFYDLETGQPMFAGAQDGKIYSTFHEMAQHNKIGYDYFTTKPKDIVTKELDRWRKRLEKAAKQ